MRSFLLSEKEGEWGQIFQMQGCFILVCLNVFLFECTASVKHIQYLMFYLL